MSDQAIGLALLWCVVAGLGVAILLASITPGGGK